MQTNPIPVAKRTDPVPCAVCRKPMRKDIFPTVPLSSALTLRSGEISRERFEGFAECENRECTEDGKCQTWAIVPEA